MSRKGRVALIVGISIAAVLLVLGAVAGIYAWRFTSVTKEITIKDIDIANVPDGEYRGEFTVFHVSAGVKVTVSGGKITKVTLVKGDSNQKQMQEVVDRVVEKQSLQVDTVSGATVSSKAVLKAIEDALSGST